MFILIILLWSVYLVSPNCIVPTTEGTKKLYGEPCVNDNECRIDLSLSCNQTCK